MKQEKISHKLLLILAVSSSFVVLSACEKPEKKQISYSVVPPFDTALARESVTSPYVSKFKCKDSPPPIKDLYFESIYDKKSGNSSIVDPKAEAEYMEKTKSIRNLEKGLSTTANRYIFSNPPRPEIAACVITWMKNWADNEGFLGKANSMGEFVRKWALASISLAYLEVKDSPDISENDRQSVENWIKKMSEQVIKDFSENTHRQSRNNNHMYWAAWGVMSASSALQDKKMYEWARDRAIEGISQIEKDGTLPEELKRGAKAYNYHHYAAIPLFLMAETARHNGDNLFAENHQGLARLARRLVINVENQDFFIEKTGEKQNLDRTISSSNLVWLEIYCKYYTDPEAKTLLDKYRPIKHSRAGGNVTLLYANEDIR